MITQVLLAKKYEVTAATISRKIKEIINFIEEYGMGGEDEELMNLKGAGTPKEQERALLHMAMEANSQKRRIQLAKAALEVYPDSPDSYLILAEESTNEQEVQAYLQSGIEAGRRELGELYFKQNKGHFWLMPESRPYIRICKSYADSCWLGGDAEEARSEERRVGKECPV